MLEKSFDGGIVTCQRGFRPDTQAGFREANMIRSLKAIEGAHQVAAIAIEFAILSAYHPAAVALFFAVSHQPNIEHRIVAAAASLPGAGLLWRFLWRKL